MNTVKSVYYGWATLIAAGGGAYYFAKKSINADRAQKAEMDRAKRQRQYSLEQAHGLHGEGMASSNPTVSPNAVVSADTAAPRAADKGALAGEIRREDRAHEDSGNPSLQASRDPAATRHAAEMEGREKSKYEASGVYRSRKGDRFS
ncbi:uncharacterized protein M421DRAFT_8307 [Didymella exigua CBS 183.55]|uniref:Uncharacterized protein n=1 Tax=Didymella exigua CBS 183.55 TaxID=1150837 RepID=A0A6A5RCE1_9PLEO|nr:uncharacterized protein M421DRAFT_8307 [Didymella exigua CBS 183.55]KAF1925049.1 hypothetical protein M421DRAFT_8307 [Didymella exigua CBS 183.55]